MSDRRTSVSNCGGAYRRMPFCKRPTRRLPVHSQEYRFEKRKFKIFHLAVKSVFVTTILIRFGCFTWLFLLDWSCLNFQFRFQYFSKVFRCGRSGSSMELVVIHGTRKRVEEISQKSFFFSKSRVKSRPKLVCLPKFRLEFKSRFRFRRAHMERNS